MPASKQVLISQLSHYPGNARRGDVEAIKESLIENGQYKPILVQRSTGFVLVGNHTMDAAEDLGWQKIAVLYLDVDDDHARRIVLADNATSDKAGYDEQLLVDLLKDVEDFSGTGFTVDEFADLLKNTAPVEVVEDIVPDPPAKPKTKPGDLIELGYHRLICGDATDEAVVAQLMGDELAHVVYTDPPYGVSYEGGQNAKKRTKLAGDESTELYGRALQVARTFSDDRAPVYLWFAGTRGSAAYAAVEAAGLEVRALIIWHKLNAHFGAYMSQYMPKHEPMLYAVPKSARWHGPANEVTVWEHPQPARSEHHPTEKPVELGERVLRNSSLTGEIVLDLFGGSGSTLIAAEKRNRAARVVELEPSYCDVIVDRWEQLTGEKAKRPR